MIRTNFGRADNIVFIFTLNSIQYTIFIAVLKAGYFCNIEYTYKIVGRERESERERERESERERERIRERERGRIRERERERESERGRENQRERERETQRERERES